MSDKPQVVASSLRGGSWSSVVAAGWPGTAVLQPVPPAAALLLQSAAHCPPSAAVSPVSPALSTASLPSSPSSPASHSPPHPPPPAAFDIPAIAAVMTALSQITDQLCSQHNASSTRRSRPIRRTAAKTQPQAQSMQLRAQTAVVRFIQGERASWSEPAPPGRLQLEAPASAALPETSAYMMANAWPGSAVQPHSQPLAAGCAALAASAPPPLQPSGATVCHYIDTNGGAVTIVVPPPPYSHQPTSAMQPAGLDVRPGTGHATSCLPPVVNGTATPHLRWSCSTTRNQQCRGRGCLRTHHGEEDGRDCEREQRDSGSSCVRVSDSGAESECIVQG